MNMKGKLVISMLWNGDWLFEGGKQNKYTVKRLHNNNNTMSTNKEFNDTELHGSFGVLLMILDSLWELKLD